MVTGPEKYPKISAMKPSRPFNPLFGGLIFVVALAACGTPPSVERVKIARTDDSQITEVLAAGYGSISEKYIETVAVEELAMEGLRGFGAVDPALTVARRDSDVVLSSHGDEVIRLPAPLANDVHGWAELTVKLADASRARSSDMRAVGAEQLYETVFDGVLSNLDIFSRYAGAAEARKNRAKRDGFGGLGIRFRVEDDTVTVTDVMPDTPAERSGLKRNDRITHVDLAPLSGLSSAQVLERLRGPTHSVVKLTVGRPGEKTARQFTIERAHIVPETVTRKFENGVLSLKVSSFNQDTARSIAAKIEESKRTSGAGLSGLILDLRGNPGGLLKQSVKVADLLLTQGRIIATSGRHPDSLHQYEAGGRDLAEGVPVIVLVDGKSASAAEIVAAALQDRDRAVVVGSSSFGKGTVQTVVRLPNDGEITLTWSRLVAPSGYTLHGLGVRPTVCTSRGGGGADAVIDGVLADRQATKATLASWRTSGFREEQRRSDLRKSCPSEARSDEIDIEIARRILAEGTLYARALELSAVADQASN